MHQSPPGTIPRLDPETVERYFKSPTPVVHLLLQDPHCELRIEPSTQFIELQVPGDGSIPDLSLFENIDIEYLNDSTQDYFSLKLAAEGMHYAAYSFIAKIVEELQHGNLFSNAISRSLNEYELLLQNRSLLSSEKQTGLLGELLLLKYLCRMDPVTALTSWLGPEAEQHDFSFGTFDLEVKTTKSERRTHRIGSATQLEPTVNRALFFLSIQITAAGTADNSFSLLQLVREVRDDLGHHSAPFNDYLASLGWRAADSDSYNNKYVLRSRPAFYAVNENFPSMQDSVLRQLLANYEHLSEISYRTDVSHLQSNSIPEELNGFIDYSVTLLRMS
ncbi:PD-(D/E)XK motif protein [Paeniglutamicibacter sulfureus]|uniref:PD-(D/E)XK motif protein n=1 Tax=Paeniglutamicibacter sulfureus TaxID=43666 RepID=UPI0026653807|nr:PD-(D/E)XK motif protein [Paeniglutamicibacter sulfureus]MDO2934652.1 PD-(D/E)XK motif protein [Paeniglutamicibacter sulfureus]